MATVEDAQALGVVSKSDEVKRELMRIFGPKPPPSAAPTPTPTPPWPPTPPRPPTPAPMATPPSDTHVIAALSQRVSELESRVQELTSAARQPSKRATRPTMGVRAFERQLRMLRR